MGEKGLKRKASGEGVNCRPKNHVHKFLKTLLFKNSYKIHMPFLFSSKSRWTGRQHLSHWRRNTFFAIVEGETKQTLYLRNFSSLLSSYIPNGKRIGAQIVTFLKTGLYIHILYIHDWLSPNMDNSAHCSILLTGAMSWLKPFLRKIISLHFVGLHVMRLRLDQLRNWSTKSVRHWPFPQKGTIIVQSSAYLNKAGRPSRLISKSLINTLKIIVIGQCNKTIKRKVNTSCLCK